MVNKNIVSAAFAWDVKNLEPFSSKDNICVGLADDVPVIIKHVKNKQNFLYEKYCLENFLEDFCTQLLGVDIENQVFMLEQILPGQTLKNVADESEKKAVEIFAKLFKKLKKAEKQSVVLPTLNEWLSIIENNSGISKEIHAKARKAIKKVTEIPHETCLLHGDLHHENILYSESKGWIAIDPKGLVGNPSFETAAFLLNPLDNKPCVESLFRRMGILQNLLNLDTDVIKNFVFLRAILGYIWDAEDKKNSKYFWEQWIEKLQEFI